MVTVIDLSRRRSPEDTQEQETEYRCGPAARWFPRVLAAAWLLSGLIVARGFDTVDELPFVKGVQWTVMVAGGMLGLWTLRAGRESGVRITVSGSQVTFTYGAQESAVAFADIDRFATDPPFAASRHLFPATIVQDTSGAGWRLPAVLIDGDRAVREIVERSEREDLRTWMDTLQIERRMGRVGLVLGAGYALALAVVAFAVAFYVT